MGTAPRPHRWRTSSFSSNGTDCIEVSWRTASFSSNGSNCVEVSNDLAAVRDSKNPDGPILRTELRELVSAIRTDRFDR
jgi:hypothetical protein